MIRIKEMTKNIDTLEERLYWIILSSASIISIVSAILTFFEHLGLLATVTSFTAAIFFVILSILSLINKYSEKLYMIMCILMSTVVFPIIFFTCGGFNCGVPLYFLGLIMIIAPGTRGMRRMITFLFSLISPVAYMLIAEYNPQYVVNISTRDGDFDIIYTLVIVGIAVFIISSNIIKTYEDERQKNEELVKKLDYAAKKDVLTNLYNRRVFFAHADDILNSKNDSFYLAMIDIDNFKKVNDTYGHSFGDIVLTGIAKCLIDNCDEKENELAARYGGEEFVCIIKSKSFAQAFSKIDAIRSNVEKLVWVESNNFKVTFSGGLVRCADFTDSNSMMKSADALLYYAKSNGKNQIAANTIRNADKAMQLQTN